VDRERPLQGRFKGGYIARHFGTPQAGIHAIQFEMCQSTYMNEAFPFAYDDARAAQVQPVLRSMVEVSLHSVQAL
jgi:N-formylglutamate deformylase